MIETLDSIPDSYRCWLALLLLVVGAVISAWSVHALIYWIANRSARAKSGVAPSALVKQSRRPARTALIVLGVHLVLPLAQIPGQELDLLRHAVSLALIASLCWFAVRCLSVIDDVIMARHPIDVRDNLRARMIHTQTQLLTRALMVVVVIVGLSAMLMTFPRIRQLGASLLASAGIAGLIVGLAARPTIGNMIAGVQLALTQPIRIDDVVIVEGEWGWIEQIKSTFVVVRIWDDRRLIVPLQYFIEHPFENWTRRSADITGSVFIHADYSLPIEPVREELQRIARGFDKWGERVCVLQVTKALERTIELRALVSAADSPSAWDLRCHVREKLIEFLQRHYPQCLPRVRASVAGVAPEPKCGNESPAAITNKETRLNNTTDGQ